MTNFVSYANALELMRAIGNKFAALGGAYIAKGNCAFASLPATPTEAQAGYVYNITDDFTTDSRFVEGAGKEEPAGSNVVIVDNSTYAAATPAGSEDPHALGWYELIDGRYKLSADTSVDASKTYYVKTVLVQYDVLGSFIDLSDIEKAISDVSKMIAGDFDATAAYSVGDVVVKDGKLYRFKAAHTAGDPWSASEVDEKDVDTLIKDSLAAAKDYTDTAKATLEAIFAPTFDSANAYAVGDLVIKDDELYKFKAAHTAGTAWSASEVDKVTVEDLFAAFLATAKAYTDAAKGAVEDSIADEFDGANAYAVGNVVYHEDKLYKFKAAHTAGDPWSLTEVDLVQVIDLIEAAEPDELTAAQIATLQGLLD